MLETAETPNFSQGRDTTEVKGKNSSEMGKAAKDGTSSPSSEKPPFTPPTLAIKYSGHSLKWIWEMQGTPKRKPLRTINMRGDWIKRIWKFKGAVIVANKKTLEIWIKTRKYKNIEKMLYNAWNKADLIAREFSVWQQIALQPIPSSHPADVQTAHIVIEEPALTPYLRAQANAPTSKLIGLTLDKSHAGKPEFAGSLSVEGAIGADYVFLRLPGAISEMDARMIAFEAVAERIELEATATAASTAQIAKILTRILEKRGI